MANTRNPTKLNAMLVNQNTLSPPSTLIESAATTNGTSLMIVSWPTQGCSRNSATNVRRYSASGTTHRNGAAATSVVMWAVTAMTSPEGIAASAVQPRRSLMLGFGTALAGAAGTAATRDTNNPATAISTASTANPADHSRAWPRRLSSGSSRKG